MRGIPVLAVARTDARRMSMERASVVDDLVEVCESLGIRVVGREDIIERDLSQAGFLPS